MLFSFAWTYCHDIWFFVNFLHISMQTLLLPWTLCRLFILTTFSFKCNKISSMYLKLLPEASGLNKTVDWKYWTWLWVEAPLHPCKKNLTYDYDWANKVKFRGCSLSQKYCIEIKRMTKAGEHGKSHGSGAARCEPSPGRNSGGRCNLLWQQCRLGRPPYQWGTPGAEVRRGRRSSQSSGTKKHLLANDIRRDNQTSQG